MAILKHLDAVSLYLPQNDWDAIEKEFAAVLVHQKDLSERSARIDELLMTDPSFAELYQTQKTLLALKISEVNLAIEDWKSSQQQKIAKSQNLLQNISKYQSNQKSMANFIDKTIE
jgi:hypothetical protein